MDTQLVTSENFNRSRYNLFMTFSLEDRAYTAPAENIAEVIKLPMLNIPEHLPEYIVGILNLRGNIINIIDLRTLLGIQSKPYSKEDCILVLSFNNITWGLIVDSVNNVINIDSDKISSTPYGNKEKGSLISNIAKTEEGLLAILNLEVISKIAISSYNQVPLEKIKQELNLSTRQNPPIIIERQFDKDTKSIEIFNKRAKELQQELNLTIEKDKSKDQRFVSFLLNNEFYAISLKYIREFSKVVNISLVPCVPDFYVGLINLRGEFIPVIDIKGFLGISKTKVTEKSKIIFIKTNKMQIGVVVDEVFDIITVSQENINKSNVSKIDQSRYTMGEIILESNEVISIFEVEKFLQDERLIIEEAV